MSDKKSQQKKPAKRAVPFDPILFAVAVPFRQATAKDLSDAKEWSADTIEPKDYDCMDAMVKDL